jgi:hypothetical protein
LTTGTICIYTNNNFTTETITAEPFGETKPLTETKPTEPKPLTETETKPTEENK